MEKIVMVAAVALSRDMKLVTSDNHFVARMRNFFLRKKSFTKVSRTMNEKQRGSTLEKK